VKRESNDFKMELEYNRTVQFIYLFIFGVSEINF